MSNCVKQDQLLTLQSFNKSNSVAILKESYNLTRVFEFEDKITLSQHIISLILKDVALKGIKDVPDDLIIDDILQMIMRKYCTLSPLEIELALQMERFGEFETKSNHFQFYGTEYVSEVLGKYIEWKIKKATELNLSRKSNQIEMKPDIEKINKEYEEEILKEIKSGNKHFRNIDSYLLYNSIPKEDLPNKTDAINLFETEKRILNSEFEVTKSKVKDKLTIPTLTELFNIGFDAKVKIRCRNIVTCEYLKKKYNL